MTAGVSTANADLALNAIVGTNYGYVGYATGDPGSAGTSNPSGNTARYSQTWGSASANSVGITNTPTGTDWPASETLEYIVNFSASSSGTFGGSAQLSASVTVAEGDTVELVSNTLSVATIAS